MKVKLVDTVEVAGKPVTFVTPPHDEPDLPWIDRIEFLKAFSPNREIFKVFKAIMREYGDGRHIQTVRLDGKIMQVIPHSIAQGFVKSMDDFLGMPPQHEYGFGSTEAAYVKCGVQVMPKYCEMLGYSPKWDADRWIKYVKAALDNCGGPFLRDTA